MKERKNMFLAEVALSCAAVIWGSAFVVLKNTLAALPPLTLTAVRFTIAAFFMLLFCRKSLGKMGKKDWGKGGILGLILFFAYAFQTVGLLYTTAGKNAFLTTVYVVLVPFFSWMFHKKRPKFGHLAAGICCLMGIGLLSLTETLSIQLGDGLTLVSGVFFGIHILCLSHYSQNVPALPLTAVQFAVMAVCSWAGSFITEPFPLSIAPSTWGGILYLVVFSTMIALTLQTVGQRHAPPGHASILMGTEAVFGALFGAWMLGERVTEQGMLGCLLIFFSVLVSGWATDTKG